MEKCSQILCAHKPCFLMSGNILRWIDMLELIGASLSESNQMLSESIPICMVVTLI